MASTFDEWANQLIEQSNLDELHGTNIALDAGHYLQSFLRDNPEPLLPAVGGLPLAMKQVVQSELEFLKKCNITPYFVFPGLDAIGKKTDLFDASDRAIRVNGAAWSLYDQHQAEQAVAKFGESGENWESCSILFNC
jgi:hypothetical protein